MGLDRATLLAKSISNSGYLDVRTLPSSGTYTLFVDPPDAQLGSLPLCLCDLPADATASISPGGPPVTVTTTVPGQNARLLFTGTAGQRVSVALSAGSDRKSDV